MEANGTLKRDYAVNLIRQFCSLQARITNEINLNCGVSSASERAQRIMLRRLFVRLTGDTPNEKELREMSW